MTTPTQSAKRRILLGVSGGIAAYKACALVSRLVQRGDDVDVIMTEEATHFVSALSFSALTRRKVWMSLWDEPEAIAHISLVREADVFIIAPATAHTIARLALGLADDLLTNAALAARIPLILAPAMNSAMYEHPATSMHLETLRTRGVNIVEPANGFLAEREFGVGRLAAEEDILAAIDQSHAPTPKPLYGKRILITAGPTREAIDPVRFVSNAASGATGIALAVEAQKRGASVRLVIGPTHLALPSGVEICRVVTAAQMLDAALEGASHAPDLILATAAVADERPVHIADHKRKKHDDEIHAIEFAPTEDIIACLRVHCPKAFVVGFAAETQRHVEHAREKLVKKHLDAIILNDVTAGRGFGPGENSWTILTEQTQLDWPEKPKTQLAAQFFDWILPHLSKEVA